MVMLGSLHPSQVLRDRSTRLLNRSKRLQKLVTVRFVGTTEAALPHLCASLDDADR
jgi:hypothetical protein